MGGVGDAVGLCSEELEDFGPSAAPLFGGETNGSQALALYANGELYHNGVVIAKTTFTRELPAVIEAVSKALQRTTNEGNSEADSDNSDTEESNTRPEKGASSASSSPSETLNIFGAGAEGEEPDVIDDDPKSVPASVFGRDSQVKCTLDTDNGGRLTFEVDGVALDEIEVKRLSELAVDLTENFMCRSQMCLSFLGLPRYVWSVV